MTDENRDGKKRKPENIKINTPDDDDSM